MRVESRFVCPRCVGALREQGSILRCDSCNKEFPVIEGIPRFISDSTHDNFALQWHRFAKTQLDSVNGSGVTRQRLLDQSQLAPSDFKGRSILEVGCGAGRFTEILLDFGARVHSVDYSTAIEVCAENNRDALQAGRLTLAQADVFHLPFRPRGFDIVFGYGMLQHTGDPRRAMHCLWERVRPGGLLLVDRYQIGLRTLHPIKYLIRPFTKRFSSARVLSWAETLCRVVVPVQRRLLGRLQGTGPAAVMRYLINRSPNSTYPLNLELGGLLPADLTLSYSVMDTFDMWAPKYDKPQTHRSWKRDIQRLEGGHVYFVSSSGQGNVAVVERSLH